MKILVTAFEPFDGETVNPAALAAERLPDTIGGAEISTEILPVVYYSALDAAIRAIDACRPDAVVMVGQAGGRNAITPERVAININDTARPDNAGNCPKDQPVFADGPAAYFSTLPVRRMTEAIASEGLPAAVSNTAGTFVCNHLMYGLLHYAAKNRPQLNCGFIHVPYLPQQTAGRPGVPSMSLDDIVRGLTAAIREVAKK